MDRLATCMRINCLGQEINLVTTTRTLTQLLNPESSAALILKRSCRLSSEKEMFLFTLTGVQVMFFFPFYSDEEQQDVDTQVLFEFAQELETRFV